MNTLNRRTPRRSRAKALVGTLAATLALAGVAQVAAPVSASAMKPLKGTPCYGYWEVAESFEWLGATELANIYYDKYFTCNENVEQH